MGSIAGERVVIKKRLTIRSESSQNAIVEGSLHGVRVLAIEIKMNHAVGPLQQRDRGARLCIALKVRQIVVFRKSFVLGRRTNAPGDVELASAEVLPKIFADCTESFVSRFVSQIRSRTVEIHRAHGMPNHFSLLPERYMRLHVGVRGDRMSGTERRSVQSLDGFAVEVMWFRSSLLNEKST